MGQIVNPTSLVFQLIFWLYGFVDYGDCVTKVDNLMAVWIAHYLHFEFHLLYKLSSINIIAVVIKDNCSLWPRNHDTFFILIVCIKRWLPQIANYQTRTQANILIVTTQFRLSLRKHPWSTVPSVTVSRVNASGYQRKNDFPALSILARMHTTLISPYLPVVYKNSKAHNNWTTQYLAHFRAYFGFQLEGKVVPSSQKQIIGGVWKWNGRSSSFVLNLLSWIVKLH